MTLNEMNEKLSANREPPIKKPTAIDGLTESVSAVMCALDQMSSFRANITGIQPECKTRAPSGDPTTLPSLMDSVFCLCDRLAELNGLIAECRNLMGC